MDSPSKYFASILGLSGFAVAVITGIARGADASATLERAIIAMVSLYALGAVLGLVAGYAIREHLERYRAENVPQSMEAAMAAYVVNDEEIEQEPD